MTDIALVRVTFGDAAEAERIGRAMVEEGLAACVNIGAPCRSIYRWQGLIEEATEVPALFKTSVPHATRLRDRIVELHGYDLPSIEIWPASTGEEVAAWIDEALG